MCRSRFSQTRQTELRLGFIGCADLEVEGLFQANFCDDGERLHAHAEIIDGGPPSPADQAVQPGYDWRNRGWEEAMNRLVPVALIANLAVLLATTGEIRHVL